MQDGFWTAIAGGSGYGSAYQNGARLFDVLDGRPAGGGGDSDGGQCAYSTLVWDPRFNELLVTAAGGHGDGADNAGYALSLLASMPAWRCISRRTPDADMPSSGGSILSSSPASTFADGYPRATHNANICWADGRVWWPFMSAVTSGEGANVDQILSYDRFALGAASSPLAYGSSPPLVQTLPGITTAPSSLKGPYSFWGSSGMNQNLGAFGVTVWDRLRHRIIAIGGNASASAGMVWGIIPTLGNTTGVCTNYSHDPGYFVFPSWAVCCYDLHIVVLGNGYDGSIMWLDINDVNSTFNTWTKVPSGQVAGTGSPLNPSVPGYFPYTNSTAPPFGTEYAAAETRAMYLPKQRAIAIVDPFHLNGNIFKLTVPTTTDTYGRTVFNPSGTFVSSEVAPLGGTAATSANFSESGASSHPIRSALIENLGDGRSAIAFMPGTEVPIFIYKIPAAGL